MIAAFFCGCSDDSSNLDAAVDAAADIGRPRTDDAGYSAFEMYLFYAAGDFERLR
ncbi:MAG: hypothetical protein ACI9KE_003003 [Polyangiales bacterium]|jgi:hypothetical protein